MTDRTLEIYSEEDARGTRNVWLRLTEDGTLILEGQDLGKQVSEFFGANSSEYEWGWSLSPERLDVLRYLLGLQAASASQPTDLLEVVASSLRNLDSPEMQERFQSAGAEFWSRIGE